MPYLNLDLDYELHPKTIRLVGLLGRGAEILPIRLWIYAAKFHAADGRFTGYSAQEIETVAKWWGASGEMVEAMTIVRFLERIEPHGYKIHAWSEHAGHLKVFQTRARKGALARWKRYASSIASSNAKREFSYAPILTSSSSSSPKTSKTQKKKSPPKNTPPQGGAFAQFWRVYPRKRSKGQAEKAWIQLAPDEPLTCRILAAVEHAKTSDQWTRDGGQFIPYPATWLRARGWEDQLDVEGVLPSHVPPMPGREDPIGRSLWHRQYGHLLAQEPTHAG